MSTLLEKLHEALASNVVALKNRPTLKTDKGIIELAIKGSAIEEINRSNYSGLLLFKRPSFQGKPNSELIVGYDYANGVIQMYEEFAPEKIAAITEVINHIHSQI